MVDSLLIKIVYRLNALRNFGKVGKGTYCIKPIRIINGKDVSIGNNVSILHFLRLEVHRVDFINQAPIVRIGDNTNIEQNVHITAGSRVIIGEECSILDGAVITDINHPYDDVNVPASRQKIQCMPVEIGNQCFVGAHAMIMPGVKLGNHVIVGANSVVTKSFPGNCVIAGVPAKIIRRYDDKTQSWVKC